MHSTTFRPFEAGDFALAKSLWLRTPGVGLSAADEEGAIVRFLERNTGLSLVAEEEGALVGTILCGHDGRRGLIHHLVVAADHRRRGIARELLRRGLAGLKAQGIDKCHLLVFQSNEPGLAFWRSLGAQERVEIALFSIATHG